MTTQILADTLTEEELALIDEEDRVWVANHVGIRGELAKAQLYAMSKAHATAEDRTHTFLMDLEAEYGSTHRLVAEASWGLGAPARSIDEIRSEIGDIRVRQMLNQAAAYARKFFVSTSEARDYGLEVAPLAAAA